MLTSATLSFPLSSLRPAIKGNDVTALKILYFEQLPISLADARLFYYSSETNGIVLLKR